MSAPNLKEIEWAISELEKQESSKAGYGLLAALYTCRRELTGAIAETTSVPLAVRSARQTEEEPVGRYGESDFLRAVTGKPPADAWRVMDELMETLLVVNRRVYDSVMRKMERR